MGVRSREPFIRQMFGRYVSDDIVDAINLMVRNHQSMINDLQESEDKYRQLFEVAQ